MSANGHNGHNGQMPYSLEAERALLGAILLRPQKVPAAQAFVNPDDFWEPRNRLAFDAMLELDRRGRPIEPLTVLELLRDRDELGRLEGGVSYLLGLTEAVATAENLEGYARIVAQRARQRELVRLCSETMAKARGECDADELLADVEQAIFKLARAYAQEQTVSLKAVLQDGMRRLERRCKGELGGITTGFPALDELWGGLTADDLVVLAARPRMGKSALAIGLLMNAASAGHPGLMFSIEMGNAQLGDRMLSAGGRVTLGHIRRGSMVGADWVDLNRGVAKIILLPIEFDFCGELSVQAIRARARRWAARAKKPGLIVVDYLQLVRLGGKRSESRELEVGEIARNLKALAKELHVPVVALAQVNRECERGTDKRPTLANLRESGAIEAHADIVCGLYRDEVYDPKTAKRGTAELITLKHRQGPEGTVDLRWLGDFTLFESLDARPDLQDQLPLPSEPPPPHWSDAQ